MRLAARALACRRGGREVFDDVDFALAAGEMLAITGPNGAGKSSLLRIAAGLLKPASGTLELAGGDAEKSTGEQSHFVGHLDALKPALTVAENLEFWRKFLGGSGISISALDRLGIAPLAEFPATILSAGQRRRLALARLLAVNRPIWLLDEPMTALDADGRRVLDLLLAEHLGSGGMVLVATHADLAGATTRLELGARP